MRATVLILTVLYAFDCPIAQAIVFNAPPDSPPSIATGDTLNFFDGGSLVDFFSAEAGSVVNLHAGFLDFFPAIRGELNIFNGTTGPLLSAEGAIINQFGGELGSDSVLENGSVLNLFSGSNNTLFHSFDSVINMHAGGSFGAIETLTRTEVNVTDGEISTISPTRDSVINMSKGSLHDVQLGAGTQTKEKDMQCAVS